MFTGWYPHVHGHRTLTNLLKPWQPNVFRLLKDAGWFVAQCGPRGDTFAPGVTAASTTWHGFAVRPQPGTGGHATAPSEAMAAALYEGSRGTGVVLDYDEAAVRTAELLLADGLPEPWVLFLPLVFPHPPWKVEEPWFSLHDRDAMPGAPAAPDLDRKPSFMRAIRTTYGLDRLDNADWRELQATYHGMVSRVDAQLGRIVDAVDRAGATDRTAVIHLTDHGEYLGDFGLVEKWPAGVDDCLVRNPLVVHVPGLAGGRAASSMVELVDLTATLLDLAGVAAPYTHFGRSLLPLLDDADAPHREVAFTEGGHRDDEPHVIERAGPPYHLKAKVQQDDPRTLGKVVAARTPRWTYVHRLYEPPELYDRAADPGELRNLAGDPAHAAVEQGLRDRILEWLLATADVVPFEPDPRFVGRDELSPYPIGPLPQPSTTDPASTVTASVPDGTVAR
jgi:arylsulfatase A-like enzyme